jgi:chromosome segregation protein
MKLKRLDISGFKSFHDRASIHFPPGVSAVVGPNGCGKSNILDALRWVMGEQSAKQLRGKSMEDVIFSGADGHAALNMAEVSLTLLNDNGSAPQELKDFTEIMLTRRLYRSGESAYFLNKQPCRLKDISNTLLGSGMGPRSYAVIQQGNISAITEAGPEERRAFVEEAAGVSRYKTQKVEALKKVAATNDNLLRVQDILSEINRQMTVLERQAKKAERYKKLRQESRRLDIHLNLMRFQRLSSEAAALDDRRRFLAAQDEGIRAELQKLESLIARIRQQRLEQEGKIALQINERSELQRSIDKLEMDLSHQDTDIRRIHEELAQLEEGQSTLTDQQERLSAEVAEASEALTTYEEDRKQTEAALKEENDASADLRNQFASLSQCLESDKKKLMEQVALEATYHNMLKTTAATHENLERRLKRVDEEVLAARSKVETHRQSQKKATTSLEEIRAEIEVLSARIVKTKAQLSEATIALRNHLKEVRRLEMEHHRIASQYLALKKTADEYDWYKDGVRAIFKAPSLPFPKESLLGVTANMLSPQAGYENAVEAVLGEALQYILVPDGQIAAAAVDFLKTHKNARAGFIPMESFNETFLNPPLTPEPRLLDHIDVQSGFEAIAETLLGDVRLAPTLSEAAAWMAQTSSHRVYVTPDGDLITREGVFVGGGKANNEGILSKKKELEGLKASEAAALRLLGEGRDRQKQLEEEVTETERALSELTEDKQRADEARMEAEKRLFTATQELNQAIRNVDILQLDQERLTGESADAAQESKTARRMLESATREVETCRQSIAATTSQIEMISKELESFRDKTLSLQLRMTHIKSQIDNGKTNLNRLSMFLEDGQKRLARMAHDIEVKTARLTDTQGRMRQARESIKKGHDHLQMVDAALSDTQSDFSNIDQNLQTQMEIISTMGAKREALRQELQSLEIDRSRAQVKIEGLEAQMRERYDQGVAALQRTLTDPSENAEAPIEMDEEQLVEALDRLRKQIETIGDVHLGAISEFESLKERASFLESQRDDLVRALDDLKQVIQKINKISADRFVQTFEAINAQLAEIFPKLFSGGSARLIMTDPHHILETGVEFLIHPPGKKLTRISLLSGGEKALSAIAFIFSIFLIKPASFCLLDEIDAPLDEANVHRFNHLLQLIGEKSQIVMVTHNKRSMEFADMLFGVTMEKQGVSKVVSVNLEKAA